MNKTHPFLKSLFTGLTCLSMIYTPSVFANSTGVNRIKFVPIEGGEPDIKMAGGKHPWGYSHILRKCEAELSYSTDWKNVAHKKNASTPIPSVWSNSIQDLKTKYSEYLPESVKNLVQSEGGSDSANQELENFKTYLRSQRDRYAQNMVPDGCKTPQERQVTGFNAQGDQGVYVSFYDAAHCEGKLMADANASTLSDQSIDKGAVVKEIAHEKTRDGRFVGGSQSWDQYKQKLSDAEIQSRGLAKYSTDAAKKIEEEKKLGETWARLLVSCEAIRQLSHHTDFEDSDVTSRKEVKSSGSGMLACMNQPNPQACMAQAQQQSSSCTTEGVETLDYVACKKIVTFIEGATLAKQAHNTTQEFRVLDSQMDREGDLMNKKAQNGTISTADMLGAQKDGVKDQADMANERGGFDAIKAGVLAKMITDMPSRESLVKECKKKSPEISRGFTALAESITNPNVQAGFKSAVDENVTNNPETFCNYLVNESGASLILNDEALDGFKMAMAQSATDALANFGKAAILNKQADKIEDAIGQIKSYEPPKFDPFPTEDAMTNECIADPNAEGCIGINSPQRGEMVGNNFTINGHNLASTDGIKLEDEDGSSGNVAGGVDNKRKLLPSSFGASLDGVSQDNSMEGAPAAGRLQAANSAGAAGGGGGGGGGSAAAPSGGSTKGQGEQGGKKSSSGKGVKVAFNGSGGGSLAWGGGRGGSGGRKPASNGNPFDKLFNKKGGNKNGEVMNLRGPASQIGSKGGNIFERISTRYSDVSKKNRLLEYKVEQ